MADTIALMKQRVLDMAIRGELVDQQPEEGTAEELLNKIILKKERMIQDGNVKKPKDLQLEVENTNENEIPSSWKWVKLDDISIINRGASPRPIKSFITDDENGINWIKIGDSVRGRKYINSTSQKITKEGAEKSVHVSKGDLIMSNSMSFGYAYIMDIDGCIHDGWLSFKVPKEEVDVEWMHYLLNANYSNFEKLAVGTGVRNLNIDRVRSVYVGLPPISEQKRIVAKIEEIFAVIDQIGTKEEEALSLIQNIRQTALQDAIRGVLVEQDDTDEPASILYEKIQAEKEKLVKEKKIKKEKPFPKIEAEEILFEIPDSWKWTRLGEISVLLNGDRGKNYPGKRYWVDEGIPFINAGTLNNRYLSKDNMNFIPEERYELLSNGFVEKNDIIYCLRGSLGKISINKDFDKGAIASSVVIIRSIGDTNVEYLYYLFTSDYGKDLIKKVDSGTAQPNLSAKNVSKYIIPLPPLAEQHRIVEKLDKIMAIFDQMEAIFDGSTEVYEDLKIV